MQLSTTPPFSFVWNRGIEKKRKEKKRGKQKNRLEEY
jgi:hypothetical protein